jgi:hypothetical protein
MSEINLDNGCECPFCGYRISDIEHQTIKFDLMCVRCGMHFVSEFNPVVPVVYPGDEWMLPEITQRWADRPSREVRPIDLLKPRMRHEPS